MGKWRMRSSDNAESPDLVSIIGEGTIFTGELVLKGGARIDGKVIGTINAHDLLFVGPTGDIEAQELRATRVTVCGSVRGKLVVQDRLEIQEGGKVSGQVVMEKQGLVVAPGGSFEGAVEYSSPGSSEDKTRRELAIEASV